MTSEPRIVPQAASAGRAGDVLEEVRAALAGVLHIDASHVDAAQQFQALGVDSLLTVEFVALLNARLGTRLAPAVLYDHSTPAALAAHVAAGEGASPAPGPASVPGGVGDGSAPAAVAEVLRGQLARILHCDAWEIDPGAAFAHLGIDSLLAAEFVAGINRAYHLTERPDVLYDHPDIASMAAHLAARITHAPPNPNPSPNPATGPAVDPGPDTGSAAGLGPGYGPATGYGPGPGSGYGAGPATGTGSAGPATGSGAGYGAGTGAGVGAGVGYGGGGGVVSGVLPVPVVGEGAVQGAGVRSPLAEQELNVLLDAVRANVLSVEQAVALLAARTA